MFQRYQAWGTEFFVILDHFFPFYPQTTQNIKILKKWKKKKHLEILSFYTCVPYMTILWWMGPRYEAWWTEFSVILDCCLPFHPPNNLKNQNFEKLKKIPGDIIILYMYTINDNHIIYGSRDMEHERQNFLSFWMIFALLPENLKN